MYWRISIVVARAVVILILGSGFVGMFRLSRQEIGMIYAIVISIALLLAGVILVAISTRRCEDDKPMPLAQRWLLVCYLLSIGACLVYLIAVLGSADFPDTAASLSQGGASPQVADAAAPSLKHAFLESVAGTSDESLTLYGQNFHNGAIVKINSNDHASKTDESGSLLSVPLQQTDLTGVNSLAIVVVNPDDKKISNSVILKISKPFVPISIFGWSMSVSRELQLLLLTICAGALGSYVHAIRSLTNFIGNRSVVASWFWWYVARPFVGMSMALIFYAVLRGGFLAGTAADAKVVNPFGVVTIGALVGMFADKAAQKLAEIFDTLFRAEDARKDKLNSPSVDKVTPDHVRPLATPPPEITITGSHLSGVEKVRINQQDRAPKSVDDKQVKIVLAAEDIAKVGTITLALVDKSGTVTSAGTLSITDLDIKDLTGTAAPDTLPDGTHATSYAPVKLTPTGGAAPYRWEIVQPVPDLAIGKDNGEISGTPKSPGDFSLTIRVTDSNKATASKTFKLHIG